MPQWLAGEIARLLGEPLGGAVESLVFGADAGPDRILESLAVACRKTCGAELVDGFLYTVSVGCVFGCVLADGRRVILKAYQPRWTVPFLEAVRRVQRHLHAGGFPCPEPIGEVVTVDGAGFVAERELPDPGLSEIVDGSAWVSASALAQLVDRCRSLAEPALAHYPLREQTHGVFPEPHSPLFDFEATKAGAEWIDDLGRRAADVMANDDTAPVIAHTDWSARNVRFDSSRVIAVYDWDSLALVQESDAIGMAASTWWKTGEPEDDTPSAEDIKAYIDAYESARGIALTPSSRRAARASTVRSMAYTARCEHSLDPHEQRWTTTRARLRSDADTLLSM